ncbi:alpha/beta fold hydrolase [Legionella rowbothamii]|uniref:alpha/beta fold hydrolase n=1 Tax=Legionella rowbothamii TaxID=96229 RepID=UPI0010562BAE
MRLPPLNENQLINNIRIINHLPLIIIHGQNDIISPPENAFELHQKWPNSTFIMVDNAGHSASEAAIAVKLKQATEIMKLKFG